MCTHGWFMSGRAKLPAIAILASSLLLPLAAPSSAAAEACLTAPKGQTPEGSHWYYRLERPSMRKCWRLVQKGEESAVPRTASRSAQPERQAQKAAEEIVPQGDVEDEAEAAPTPNPPAARIAPPQTAAAPTKPATSQTQPPQSPAINNWATRDTSSLSTSEVPLPLPPPAPSADATPRADSANQPAPLEQTAQSDSAPTVITQQPVAQPLATGGKNASASDREGTSVLRLLPTILALLGLAGCAAFYVRRMMRRRSDVLTVMQDADSYAPEAPLAPDAATFEPLPPIGLQSRGDDVDEALRRFTQNWKRRAA